LIKIALSLFFSGFLFGCGPCLASCGPLLISYIAGTKKNVLQAAIFYSLFSFSRIAVYLALALGVYFLGNIVQEYLFPGYVALLGGIFIGLCGLFLVLGISVKVPFISSFSKIFTRGQVKNPLVFGLIYGLIPCAPFLSVLSYIGLISRNWGQALAYTLCFGLGSYLSPLLALSVFSGTFSGLLGKAREKYTGLLGVLCGLVMIFLGIQLARRAF
jgi:sulfite exporter TauE/SafE